MSVSLGRFGFVASLSAGSPRRLDATVMLGLDQLGTTVNDHHSNQWPFHDIVSIGLTVFVPLNGVNVGRLLVSAKPK